MVRLTLVAGWVFWGVVLYVYTRRLRAVRAIFQLAKLVFAGRIAECWPQFPDLIVSKRPGCLVGLATALGIAAGVLVMLWSFGPAIFCCSSARAGGKRGGTHRQTRTKCRRTACRFSTACGRSSS